jgi:hypothetical protein
MKTAEQNGADMRLADPFDRYQYILQRLRWVFQNQKPFFEVVEIVDLPFDSKGTPAIAINLKIAGMRLDNPVTGKAMLSKAKLQDCLDGWPVQELLWRRFAQYLGDTIPASSSAAKLKKKFETAHEGQPGKLPPTADLRLIYETLTKQLNAVRDYLRKQPPNIPRTLKHLNQQFLNEVQERCPWWDHVQNGDIPLRMIETRTPNAVAFLVLSLRYGVEEEALKSRLYRKSA